MRRPAAFFPIALAVGVLVLAPRVGAQVQDSREEGPFEIEKCQTISKPGSYKLVNNLTFTGSPNTGCLTITTDSVTVDLAGFTISGPSFGVGITAQPPQDQVLHGLAVRNGSISGIRTGVGFVNLAVASIVEGLRIDGSNAPAANIDGTGILADGIVKGNTVTSFFTGISGTGLVTSNYALLNSGTGFSIGAGSTVIGNTARNSQVGFFVDCPSNVTDNTGAFNTTANLQLNGNGCNNTNNVAP